MVQADGIIYRIKTRPPLVGHAHLSSWINSLQQQQVLDRLAEDLLQAEQAAQAAHETATHEENIAENKYDTLGLEAAYLATGQVRRAEAVRQAPGPLAPFPPAALRRQQRVSSSARWSAWLVPMAGSNTSFSARMAAA